jgi:hypothetical protein
MLFEIQKHRQINNLCLKHTDTGLQKSSSAPAWHSLALAWHSLALAWHSLALAWYSLALD